MVGIIGAGPVGLVTALIADSKGEDFELFEQKTEAMWKDPIPQRAIGITLSDRGIKVIKDLDLFETIKPFLQSIVGREFFNPDAVEQFDYDAGRNSLYSISRNKLINILYCAFLFRTGKKINFSHKLYEVDVEKKIAYFEDPKQKKEFTFSRLLAADGSNSVLQKKLLQLKGAEVFHQESAWSYLPLIGSFSNGAARSDRIHILSREHYFLVGIPHHDGTISLTLSYKSNTSLVEKIKLLSQMEIELNKFGVKIFFENNAFDALFVRERLFFCNVTTTFNKKLPITLIGDARHQLIHLLGQGLNLGLEEASLAFELSEKDFNKFVNSNSLVISGLALKQVIIFANKIRSSQYMRLLRLRECLNRRAVFVYKNEYVAITTSRKNLRLVMIRIKVQHFFENVILLLLKQLKFSLKKTPNFINHLAQRG